MEQAFSGDEALHMFKNSAPNLILLDIMLPGMDGWQVCREVRKVSNIPIIMLTAKDETFDKMCIRDRPIGRRALSMAKFVVAAFYLFLEMAVFFGVFSVAGPIAALSMGVREALPAALLAAWCAGLFVSMLPCLALIWAVCVLFENSALSVGLNLVLVIPGVLVANTPAYIVYPYCYSGYLVSCYLDRFTSAGATDPLSLVPFLPCAAALFGAALFAAAALFGKKAMR